MTINSIDRGLVTACHEFREIYGIELTEFFGWLTPHILLGGK